MKDSLVGAFALAAAFVGFAAGDANARFSPQRIEAPDLVEQAACTVRRETRRPAERPCCLS